MPRTLALVVTMVMALAPLAAEAQRAAKPPLVAVLAATNETFAAPYLDAGRQALRELGYVEGRDVALEIRFYGGRADKLPDLTRELVALGPRALVVMGDVAVRAVKQAEVTLPVVFISASDPVAAGLVTSLAHPGGNFTGVASILPELNGKELALLKEALPKLSRVAVLWNPNSHGGGIGFREIQRAAQTLGVTVQSVEARTPAELERAFTTIRTARPDGMLVLTDPLTFGQRKAVIEFTTKAALPTMFEVREFVDAGALLSYGPSLVGMVKRAAVLVDRILKGASPANLPVEQPTRFELVINLKTAKALGLTIPPSLVVRADHVIE
jgi:putative ABC transport system substrate-binding protein